MTAAQRQPARDIRMSPQQVAELYRIENQRVREIMDGLVQMGQIQAEIKVAKQAIRGVNQQKNPKIMVPLGGGVMAEAVIADNNRFKIPMAGNVVIERTAEEALLDMERAEEETKKQVKELEQQQKTASENLRGLAAILQKVQQQ